MKNLPLEPILHQPSHVTKMDRYPDLFSFTASLIKNENCKILSFGCSSGEECISLRKYFPKAHIVGAEINQDLLSICREKQDSQMDFIHSKYENLKKHGPYDLIFSLNVFNRNVKDPENYPLYVFSYFEDQINQFHEILHVDGLLILQGSKHNFKKTEVFENGFYYQLSQKTIFQKIIDKI